MIHWIQVPQTCTHSIYDAPPLGSASSVMASADDAQSSSGAICTKSFLVTISTKTDVSMETRAQYVTHVTKQCDFYHIVIEKDKKDVRHLHAIVLYPEYKNRRDLQGNIWKRFVKPFHMDDGSIGKFAVKVQVAPGSEWYDDYLNKQDDVEVLATKWDDDVVDDYWPDDATQQFLQETYRKGSNDGWIATHLDDFQSKFKNPTFDDAYEYCLRWYFEHKRDPDTRVLRQRSVFMHRFAVGDFVPRHADRLAYGNDDERAREYERVKRARVDGVYKPPTKPTYVQDAV